MAGATCGAGSADEPRVLEWRMALLPWQLGVEVVSPNSRDDAVTDD